MLAFEWFQKRMTYEWLVEARSCRVTHRCRQDGFHLPRCRPPDGRRHRWPDGRREVSSPRREAHHPSRAIHIGGRQISGRCRNAILAVLISLNPSTQKQIMNNSNRPHMCVALRGHDGGLMAAAACAARKTAKPTIQNEKHSASAVFQTLNWKG